MKRLFAALLILIMTVTPQLAMAVNVTTATKIPLTFNKLTTSKTAEAGQKIEAMVAEDVKINDTIVFKKGGRAYLNLSESKKAGMLGNPGKLIVMNGQAYDANEEPRSIEFYQTFVGEEKTYPKVLLGVSVFLLFPLALFALVKGGQAQIKTGEIFEVTPKADFVFNSSGI